MRGSRRIRHRGLSCGLRRFVDLLIDRGRDLGEIRIGREPFVLEEVTHPHEWIAALESIGALEARLYVPGHGQVLNDHSRIDKLISYFRALTTQVDSLVATGLPLEKVEEKVDLSQSRALLAGDDEHAQRFFDEVRNEAIGRAYAEATHQAN